MTLFCRKELKKRFQVRAEVTNNPTMMVVVAAAIAGPEGRWLMHRRPPGKHHGGLWEFPGGKVEVGEAPRHSLVRELKEELGITVESGSLKPAGFAESEPSDGNPRIVILLYTIGGCAAQAASLEGGEVGWFTVAQIVDLPVPPLDRALAEQLFAGAA